MRMRSNRTRMLRRRRRRRRRRRSRSSIVKRKPCLGRDVVGRADDVLELLVGLEEGGQPEVDGLNVRVLRRAPGSLPGLGFRV